VRFNDWLGVVGTMIAGTLIGIRIHLGADSLFLGLGCAGLVWLGCREMILRRQHEQEKAEMRRQFEVPAPVVTQIARHEDGFGFIDSPSPFAPTARWEAFLHDLENDPRRDHPDMQREIGDAKVELARRKAKLDHKT